MSSYKQILYQIVFRTKHSEKTLDLNCNDELFKYIWGITKNKNCHLYRINGMEEHIHLLVDLHPSIALSDLIRDIKSSSSKWLKESKDFTHFKGWADGYSAFTYARWDKDRIINYIKNQQQHHKKESFKEEYIRLLEEHDVDFDPKYFLL